MTCIKALEIFGLELDEPELTTEAAKKLPELDDGDVQMDFSGCVIDYEAASIIMDATLTKMAGKKGPKTLILIYNIPFQQRMFLKWFFLGSQVLGLHKGTASDEDILTKVKSGLQRLEVALKIHIIQKDHTLKAEYTI